MDTSLETKSQHGGALQLPPGDHLVAEALSGFYKSESILARSCESAPGRGVEVTFLFPAYDRTENSMGHVSAVQMHAALLEGLYIAVAASIRDGDFPSSGLSIERFREHRHDFILFKQDIIFGKMLREGETGKLLISIEGLTDVSLMKDFKQLTFKIKGFMKGTVRCLVPKTLADSELGGV